MSAAPSGFDALIAKIRLLEPELTDAQKLELLAAWIIALDDRLIVLESKK